MVKIECDAEYHRTSILRGQAIITEFHAKIAKAQAQIANSEVKLQAISDKASKLTRQRELTQYDITASIKELEEARAKSMMRESILEGCGGLHVNFVLRETYFINIIIIYFYL